MSHPPIVIVKKRRGHHGAHGGAWKVAYADFVTAMMAFFLVMWLVGQSKAVRAGVAGYFRNPGAFASQQGNGVLTGGRHLSDEPSEAQPAAQTAADRAALEQSAAHIRERLNALPELKALRDQVELTVTDEGLRIDLVERDNSSFFDTGSAVMHPETERLLALIARELGTLPNDVVVEGHTDSRQYTNTDKYTNWELSADRANAARRVLERQGLHPGQVVGVRGLADRHPRIAANPLDPRNRRVSVLVRNLAARR